MFIRTKREDKGVRRAGNVSKEREKRRKKMLRTKYGQKPLKHAKKGVQSSIFAGVAWALLIFMLIVSFHMKGDVGVLAGMMGLFILILAGTGLNLGLKGFKERDKNYITCKAGTIGNGLLLLGMAAIFIRGIL